MRIEIYYVAHSHQICLLNVVEFLGKRKHYNNNNDKEMKTIVETAGEIMAYKVFNKEQKGKKAKVIEKVSFEIV